MLSRSGDKRNGLMPAARELMMLSRLLIMPGVEQAVQIIWVNFGQFVLARADAQRVYGSMVGLLWWVNGAARESHNEPTRNTLKHSTCERHLNER